jgi:ribosomal protein S18 acetylase RimI-like enzyme
MVKDSLRLGGIEDFEALKQLGILAYSPFERDLEKEHWHQLKAYLHDECSLKELIKKSTVWVYEDNSQIVGMAFLLGSGNGTHIFSNDTAYIRMVGVNPSYRGRGIAKQLTQQCIAHTKQNGETGLELHTSEFMEVARHLYESLGFERVKELSPIFGKRYWLYRLKTIDSSSEGYS